MSRPNLTPSRAFMTQLFNSLTAVPPPSAPIPGAPNNPLSSVPEPVKKQFLTLHVLFPSELLPALDLLDRRLVRRFRIRSEPDSNTATPRTVPPAPQETPVRESSTPAERGAHVRDDVGNTPSAATPASRHIDGPQFPQTREHGHNMAPKGQDFLPDDTVYYVRSAQQKSARYSASWDSTTWYEVRLQAWNCSCPAFAFAAFPAVLAEPLIPLVEDTDAWRTRERAGSSAAETQTAEHEWSFGGHCLCDAMPPVCKHLLACVLVQRCPLFAAFVEDAHVSVAEAAAWAAGWGD